MVYTNLVIKYMIMFCVGHINNYKRRKESDVNYSVVLLIFLAETVLFFMKSASFFAVYCIRQFLFDLRFFYNASAFIYMDGMIYLYTVVQTAYDWGLLKGIIESFYNWYNLKNRTDRLGVIYRYSGFI